MTRYDPTLTALLHPEAQATLFASGQNWPIEAVCAECSRLAYVRFERSDGERAALTAALAFAGLTRPAFFSDAASGAQAFAALDPPRALGVIAFRGTQPDELADIGTDAQAVLVDWQGRGKVHLGFRNALNAVLGPIESWLGQAQPRDLWVTGHSLGAAIATLAAALMPAARLVNFGSPRVGDAAFAAQFEGRIVKRYVDCCDLVTHLPPQFVGYAHVPGRIYIDRNGRLTPGATDAFMDQDGATARREYLADQAWRLGNAGLRDLADHSAINYVSGVMEDRQ